MSPRESAASPCGATNFPVARPGPASPPSRDDFAFAVHDGEARTDVWVVSVHRHRRAQLADDELRFCSAAAVEAAGPVHVGPLRFIFSVSVEHLNAMVLAVGGVHPAFRVRSDDINRVNRRELKSKKR